MIKALNLIIELDIADAGDNVVNLSAAAKAAQQFQEENPSKVGKANFLLGAGALAGGGALGYKGAKKSVQVVRTLRNGRSNNDQQYY